MAVVSLRPIFRVPLFHHLPPNPKRSNPFDNPRSNISSIFSSSSLSSAPREPQTFRTLATESDFNAPQVNPFCFLLPILQSFGSFIASRLPKLRPFLRGGRDAAGDGTEYVCCGGIGMLLMSTTAALATKTRVRPFLLTLAANPTFMAGLMAWALAQTLKMVLNFFVERTWDFGMLVSSGGMPSSHSALCMALTASVALCHGVGDSLFPVCLGFSLIVMYDAIGVRRHAGMQAEVLNKIIEDLFQGHPISERKLKELLGHTPSQVIAGAVLGIFVACVCCQGSVVAI